MKNAMLIGALIVFVIAAIVWATRRERYGGWEEYDNSKAYGSKFTSKVDGRCPSGTVEITYGGHKGECYKGRSSGRSSSRRSSSRGSSSRRSSPSRSGSTNYGSKFVGKSNGKCPSGTTEITSGGRRGQCIKNEARENIESNRKNVGSIYRKKEAASCPKGTTLIKSGSKKGMCIDEGKAVYREYKFWGWGANAGLRCKNSNNTGCNTKWSGGKLVKTNPAPASKPAPKPRPGPSSTPLSNPSDFKYPGKGKTEGLMCKNQDGTVCDVSSRYNRNQWPYWGWGVHAGMKCKNSNNTGCSFDYAKK
jgi:hypothetical protein